MVEVCDFDPIIYEFLIHLSQPKSLRTLSLKERVLIEIGIAQ
jgi:hypothetical protein